MKKRLLAFSRGFSLIELLVVITIIGILAAVGTGSFTTAQKRSRDAKRKSHLNALKNALEAYHNDFGQYPADDMDGKISGCGTDGIALCSWGDEFSNTTKGTIYMVELPQDPASGQNYYYDTPNLNKAYQLYANLENDQDQALNLLGDEILTYSGTECASNTECNYGQSSSNITPESNHQLH